MDAFVIGLLTSACVLAGALVGLNLRRILPEHHLTKETQEVVRLGSSTVSIVASLVLGLLIATAKSSSDNLDREMQAFSADLVMMDEVLRSYGHEAEDLRALLRQATLRTLHDVRPAPAELLPGLDDAAAGSLLSQLQQRVRSLPAKGLAQERLRDEALSNAQSLVRQRHLLAGQSQPGVHAVVLAVVVAWIVTIFVSFGLGAPQNVTVVCSFALAALAIGTAVYLILELDSPLNGILRISVAPLQAALAEIGRPL
jgi:hypothetical protein